MLRLTVEKGMQRLCSAARAPLSHVFKVYATVSEPNHILPWQWKPQREQIGSGTLLPPLGRSSGGGTGQPTLVTNAHVVAGASQVHIRPHGSARRFPAQVTALGHDCDLAVLTPVAPCTCGAYSCGGGGSGEEGDSRDGGVRGSSEGGRLGGPGQRSGGCFFCSVGAPDGDAGRVAPATPAPTHLELGPVPELQDAVAIVGYPTGGDSVSVTSGVVSRVGMQRYAHGSNSLLAVQIDAAVNPGNSGGPAVKDDACVGIAFMSASNAEDGVENMGFVIPTPVVRRFLEEVERSGGGDAYRGVPSAGVMCQAIENGAMRASLGLADDDSGVLVCEVQPTSGAAGRVRAGDVLLAIDGFPVASDGTVPFRGVERVSLDYVVSSRQPGDVIALDLIRGGRPARVEVPLSPIAPLVPIHWHLEGGRPSYYVYGGIVFAVLTQPLLYEFGEDWHNDAPRRLSYLAEEGIREGGDEEIVVVTQVLSDEVNDGYQSLIDRRVLRVNDVQVHNLASVRNAILGNTTDDRYVTLELDLGAAVVLDRQQAEARAPRIMEHYCIPRDYFNPRDPTVV